MATGIPETPRSVPELIRDSQQQRRDLDLNLTLLQATIERSKTLAAQIEWSPEANWSPEALTGAPPAAAESRILERLTKRELEVLRLIAEGKSSKMVAAELGMAFRTAVCHRYRIFQKLQVHETASLVRLAVRAGLVKP